MPYKIIKIKLKNFKCFKEYTIEANEKINILVGDNETGKSSILDAINIVTKGSNHYVKQLGLDNLLNIDAVNEFLISDNKSFKSLPQLIIELYINDQGDYKFNGKNNTDGIVCDGMRMICKPSEDYRNEIQEIFDTGSIIFPYDYYNVEFTTFAGESYGLYKKKVHAMMIDHTNMNTEYSIKGFVSQVFNECIPEVKDKLKLNSEYRNSRENFNKQSLKQINENFSVYKNYMFGLKNGKDLSLVDDLAIYEDGINIKNHGTGEQVFIKTELILNRMKENIDIVLIEEPENHLSPVNLRKIIDIISINQDRQLFITTHSNHICTRLDLCNLLILGRNNNKPLKLNALNPETSKFFIKAPVADIIEFILSPKTLLVEGPSEYILMEKFYKLCTGHRPENDQVSIIDVRGLSFLRYLEITKSTHNKVAVITDNDSDYEKNCIEKYKNYKDTEHIEIFYDNSNELSTFELVLYKDNKELCHKIFNKANDITKYMINNKTECAYQLLIQSNDIIVPDYVKRAIRWIKD